MAYATSADVQNAAGGAAKLLALVDHDANGSADAGVIDAAIAEADALIDSYAAKRHTVPFSSPSTNISKMSARMAVRILRRNRGMMMEQDLAGEEQDRKWLEALASGGVTVGTDPPPPASTIVRDHFGTRDTTKEVSRDKLKGYW